MTIALSISLPLETGMLRSRLRLAHLAATGRQEI